MNRETKVAICSKTQLITVSLYNNIIVLMYNTEFIKQTKPHLTNI